MIKRSTTFSIILGLALANGILANDPKTEKEFDVNSINYLEDEPEFELGFNTADYLPEGFDPYSFYFDINTVTYIKSNEIEAFDGWPYLPESFNAYAYPTDVESINYIDVEENIALGIDTAAYLPKDFDPYSRN